MVTTIITTIIVVAATFLAYVATRPSAFRVERSLLMKASPDKIYPLMSDFHKGGLWSPYEKKDPAMKRTFSGPDSGKGSVYEFDGNKKTVGKGRLEIIEVSPPNKVVLTLDMVEPVAAHNTVEYTLAPNGDGTKVTWAMHGRNSFLGKVVCLFMNMDRMVGKDFEEGLTNLKAVVEKT